MSGSTQPTDAELVEAVLRNRNAYAQVVNRYERVLTRYLNRLLGPRGGAAADVLQDVFIKAYLNLNDYDRSRPFSPWIYRIAHNEAMSHLRRNRTEPQPLDSADAELILERLAADDDPAKILLRKRADHAVRAAVSDLEVKYRDVLVLRYLEEKSYDEIADILHMPPGTVATLIARGLKKLKSPLELNWGKA